jgi:cytochrome c556
MARFRILVGAALLLGGWPVQAHEGATGVVKERMEAMESMASATKEIRRRIVGNRDFPAITAEAARIAALAQRLPEWFPPGSDAGPSEALPAIWRQWPKFQAEAERLALQAGKLGQSAASGDPKEVAAQYRSLGQVCLDCHQTFRAKR